MTASGSVSEAVTASTPSGIGARLASGRVDELGQAAVAAEPEAGAAPAAEVRAAARGRRRSRPQVTFGDTA